MEVNIEDHVFMAIMCSNINWYVPAVLCVATAHRVTVSKLMSWKMYGPAIEVTGCLVSWWLLNEKLSFFPQNQKHHSFFLLLIHILHHKLRIIIDYYCLVGFLPMSVVCKGTSTQPSIADLLEWLSDLQRIHSELYPLKEKKNCLWQFYCLCTMLLDPKPIWGINLGWVGGWCSQFYYYYDFLVGWFSQLIVSLFQVFR